MAELLALELGAPAGEPVRFEWRPDELASLDPATAGAGSVWALGGDPDWEQVGALRVLSGRFEDGRTIAIAAVRPVGTGGHGDELIAGALGDDEGFERLEQVLLSTEYGPDGLARRIGLELYRPSSELPLRIAADATEAGSASEGGVERSHATCVMRLGELGGVALYEVLTPA